MKRSRRKFSFKFRAMVAIETLKEQKNLAELAIHFEVHSNQIFNCKRALLDNVEQSLGLLPNRISQKLISRISTFKSDCDQAKYFRGVIRPVEYKSTMLASVCISKYRLLL